MPNQLHLKFIEGNAAILSSEIDIVITTALIPGQLLPNYGPQKW